MRGIGAIFVLAIIFVVLVPSTKWMIQKWKYQMDKDYLQKEVICNVSYDVDLKMIKVSYMYLSFYVDKLCYTIYQVL